jgi:hypothetical protein
MRAEVRQVEKTKHAQGMILDGKPVATEAMGEAKWVEITEDSGGFVLLRYDDADEVVGDTWHLTLVEAKAQAEFEYGVSEAEWRD